MARKVEDVDRLILRAIFRAVEQGDAWNQTGAERATEDRPRPHYEALVRLTAELDTLGRTVTEREAERDRHQEAVSRLTAGRVTASIPRDLRSIWPGLSLDRQRAIVAALVERIEVHPQGKARSTRTRSRSRGAASFSSHSRGECQGPRLGSAGTCQGSSRMDEQAWVERTAGQLVLTLARGSRTRMLGSSNL